MYRFVLIIRHIGASQTALFHFVLINPVSEPDGRTSLDLVDVGTTDQVEVARSNVSAQYGNASGGVVNLRTNLDFDRSFLRVEESGGSFGLRRDQVTYGYARHPRRRR